MNQPVKVPTLDELTAAMKADILQRMRSGIIPVSASSFGELHDYCDANCLAGLCTDALFEAIWLSFGPLDAPDGMPDGMLALINGAQDAVNDWLASGQAKTEFAGSAS